jgi:ATP-binding cassette subfamily F protein 3
MLSARDLTLRRGAQPLFEQVSFTIFRGNKVGLTGANGTGKSSLIAAIRGELAPDRGTIDLPATLKVAHVEQEIAASSRSAIDFVLDGDLELREVQAAIADADRRGSNLQLADLYSSLEAIGGFRAKARAAGIMHGLGFKAVGCFGFRGDRAFDPVGRFSGGEKARLTLALLVARRPNLLLLDEPTNHLDIDMRQALSVALQSFDGGLVVVSHDRHLIKSVADTLWLVADGRSKVFDGDLDDYQQWLRSRGKAQPSVSTGKTAAKKTSTRNRDPLSRLRRLLDKLEASIAVLTAERLLIDAELAANPLHDKLRLRRANLERDAAYLETQWMEIGTAIEAAESQEPV